MLWCERRVWIGAAILLTGMACLSQPQVTAADIADDLLKKIMEADIKRVNDLIKDYNAAPDKKMPRQIKSSAMMVAAYAQSQITGKDAKADAKMAALRDQAIAVAETVAASKLKGASGIDMSKDPGKADTKPVSLHSKAKFDIDDLMAQFKKTEAAGLNLEKDIKEGAKDKGPAVDHLGIAARTLIVAEFLKDVKPTDGFKGGKKTEKEWMRTTGMMDSAAKDLVKANGKGIQAALKKLDAACTACHNTFKTD